MRTPPALTPRRCLPPLLAHQAARVYTDKWVGYWFSDKYNRPVGFYLGIYFMMGAVYGITTFVRSTTFLFFCVVSGASGRPSTGAPSAGKDTRAARSDSSLRGG